MAGADQPEFERYALYWAPAPDSAMAGFGRGWLGIDAVSGPAQPRVTYGLEPAFVEAITAEPRRYALHGTLKAPFRLRAGVSVSELHGHLRRFCQNRRAVEVGQLALTREGPFLALMPKARCQALDWLATSIVIGFDAYRAPIDAADRARRRLDRMPPAERLLFEQWGYPYVLNQFRFHVTLTSALDRASQERVEAALTPALAPLLAQPLSLDSICLFGDPGGGQPFREIARHKLIA